MDTDGKFYLGRVYDTKAGKTTDQPLLYDPDDLTTHAVVVGMTGSGKSTTLAAVIDNINRNEERHIVTIEDPLEFVHENRMSLITQREIGAHARSFSDALRVASREDPDIILVGEMRDLETISLALTCAELGILVFGTLHTNSATKTIDRIINAFPAIATGASHESEGARFHMKDKAAARITIMMIRNTVAGRFHWTTRTLSQRAPNTLRRFSRIP